MFKYARDLHTLLTSATSFSFESNVYFHYIIIWLGHVIRPIGHDFGWVFNEMYISSEVGFRSIQWSRVTLVGFLFFKVMMIYRQTYPDTCTLDTRKVTCGSYSWTLSTCWENSGDKQLSLYFHTNHVGEVTVGTNNIADRSTPLSILWWTKGGTFAYNNWTNCQLYKLGFRKPNTFFKTSPKM